MTITEAKATIYANVVYACEKAGLAPQTTRLVQDACDTIIAIADACETIVALADRKTENCSEIPNNCETCRFELYCPEMCDGCCEWDSHYEPKTEPTISKMEQVDKDINVRSKDEPQTLDDIGKQIQDAYDKGFLSDADAVQAWYEAVKDEPQTERSENE